jgi:ferredoxin/flavodoxin---NADP+ reductase
MSGPLESTTPPTPDDLARWREENYNATVTDAMDVHSDLRILRVRPDARPLDFTPGQYTVLGLGAFEPCVDGESAQLKANRDGEKLIRRAYSFAGSLLDGEGRLLRTADCSYLEFYLALIHGSPDHPPGLTPRLFRLVPGARLFVSPHPHGRYTLVPLAGDESIVFVATGTGEAPHNAMLAELLTAGHRGPITSVTCVRRQCDLAYLTAHRELERRYANYRYMAITTREPENLDPAVPGFVGKRYLQEYFESGAFERERGLGLLPERTHVYLCGSPAMVGLPEHTPSGPHYPRPKGMVEVLEARQFVLDHADRPGNMHCERYW